MSCCLPSMLTFTCSQSLGCGNALLGTRRHPCCDKLKGSKSKRAAQRLQACLGIPPWATAVAKQHKFVPAPHAGSHFTRRDLAGRRKGRFFEGWFLRAVLPGEQRVAFAFMFTIEELAETGERVVTAQVMGPDEKLFVKKFAAGDRRWFASPDTLSLGNWEVASSPAGSPRPLAATLFASSVSSGFQLTSSNCSGRMNCVGPDDSDQWIRWYIDMVPLLSWGSRADRGRCTGTWLSYLPVFEPGYQVLMAHGIASQGSIHYNGRRWDLQGAVLYAEKNWGAAFPKKWWWCQANKFNNIPDMTVTTVGARRLVAQLYEETIGMIAVHINGRLYEFSNWNCHSLSWNVKKWGLWEARAKSRTGHEVSMIAKSSDAGAFVLGPSMTGMMYNIHDAAYGEMSLSLRSPDGRFIVKNAKCDCAQVEIGGGPWDDTWNASVKPLSQPLRGLINIGSRKVETSL